MSDNSNVDSGIIIRVSGVRVPLPLPTACRFISVVVHLACRDGLTH